MYSAVYGSVHGTVLHKMCLTTHACVAGEYICIWSVVCACMLLAMTCVHSCSLCLAGVPLEQMCPCGGNYDKACVVPC